MNPAFTTARYTTGVACPVLAPLGQVTIAHGLNDGNGRGLIPSLILPDRATPIVVLTADENNITFENQGSGNESAVFWVELEFSTQRDPNLTAIVPGFSQPAARIYWQGNPGGGGGGGGNLQAAYDAGPNGEIVVSAALGAVAIRNAATPIPFGPLFTVTDNTGGDIYLEVGGMSPNPGGFGGNFYALSASGTAGNGANPGGNSGNILIAVGQAGADGGVGPGAAGQINITGAIGGSATSAGFSGQVGSAIFIASGGGGPATVAGGGSGGFGAVISLRAGDGAGSVDGGVGAGGDIQVTAGTGGFGSSTTVGGTGGAVTITAGFGGAGNTAGAGDGGPLTLIAGQGGTDNGFGGGVGGAATLSSGRGADAGGVFGRNGGITEVTSGGGGNGVAGLANGFGGTVRITSGAGGASADNSAVGGRAGLILISPAQGVVDPFAGVPLQGASVLIVGGIGGATTNNSGQGGNVVITGGNAGAGGGNGLGGNVNITGGDADGSANGGAVNIVGGVPAGAGARGAINIGLAGTTATIVVNQAQVDIRSPNAVSNIGVADAGVNMAFQTGTIEVLLDAADEISFYGDLTIRTGTIINLVAANEVTTVGAAGGATALPATPTGYYRWRDSGGVSRQFPYYDI